MRFRFGRLLFLAVFLAGLLPVPSGPVAAQPPEVVTARLGISAGTAIEDLPPGTAGPALEQRIPILFETAAGLGIGIETVSVGQGFYSENGELLSERDLDLVVTGPRDAIVTLGASLGRAWDQSLVFIWYADAAGSVATATIPLPGGADALTDEVYRDLVSELADGGHVRYAGADSLLFVANTGVEPDADFSARMSRVHHLLERAGIGPGPIQHDRAEMVAIDLEVFDDYVLRAATVRAELSARGAGR